MRKQEGLYPFDVLLTRSPDAVGIGAGVLKPDWFDPCPKPGTDHFPKREFHLHADGRKRNRWGSQAQARGSVRVVLVSKGVLIECIYAHGQSFRRPLPNQTSTLPTPPSNLATVGSMLPAMAPVQPKHIPAHPQTCNLVLRPQLRALAVFKPEAGCIFPWPHSQTSQVSKHVSKR